MKDLCRTCGEIPLNSNVKILFEDKELVAFVKYLTRMQIKNDAKLPIIICKSCGDKLNEMISFQKRCILVQNYFNFKIWKEFKPNKVVTKRVRNPDPLTNADDLEISADVLDSVYSTSAKSKDNSIEKDISHILETKEDKEDDSIGHDGFSSKLSLKDEKEQSESEDKYDSMEYNKTAFDELIDFDELESIGPTDVETNEAVFTSEQEDNADQNTCSTVDKEGYQVDQNSKTFICDICGKVLRSMASLRRHRLTHNTFKRFKCRICTKAYHTLWDLEQHVLIHTDNHPYVCRFCSAKFTYPNAKRRHEKIHTNERPHKCSHCGKGFIASSTLKQHEATHTRIKNFRCGTCGFFASSQKQLARHLKTKTHSKNENEQNRRLEDLKFEIEPENTLENTSSLESLI